MELAKPSASYAALPPGYGFSLGLPVQTLDLPFQALARPAIPNAPIQRPESAPAWVQRLADWHPGAQGMIAAVFLAFSLIAYIGLRTNDGSALKRNGLIALSLLSVYGISQSNRPASIPEGVYAAATQQAERIQVNNAELARIIRISPASGMVEPIAWSDAVRLKQLFKQETPVETDVSPGLATLAVFFPALLTVFLFALSFLRGWHYLFVSHPATSVAGPPLRSGTLFPKVRLAQALRPDPAQLFDHPAAYKSRDMTEKAQALRNRIDADADIAEAAMRRDRARAAKMQADAELREARKKLPWWQRWLWW